MHEATDDQLNFTLIPNKDIPPVAPVSAEEVERRRKAVEKLHRLRKRIGPIGIRADDLLHESRAEPKR